MKKGKYESFISNPTVAFGILALLVVCMVEAYIANLYSEGSLNPILFRLSFSLFLIPIYLFLHQWIIDWFWSLNQWWKNLTCKLFGHKPGALVYKYSTDENCQKNTWCKRCDQLISQVLIPHQLGVRLIYQPENSIRTDMSIYYTDIDGEIKKGSRQHSSGCRKGAACMNCRNFILLGIIDHQEMQIVRGCETGMKCQNCGNFNVTEEHHRWRYRGREVLHSMYEGLSDTYIVTSADLYECRLCHEKYHTNYEET